ncbi:MAG: ACP S-malonyltransferase [Bauldia sp.]|nr:ACP S-malonyltransferase [Bauldia sp.]
MGTALIFPGQGSQAVGMGKALADAYPAAAAVFAEVDDALGEKLSPVVFEGPAEALTLTRNTQPALMAVSIAALRALTGGTGQLPASVTYLAGHSLGEYAALAAAGSLTLADTARLLRLRGEAMQRAVPPGEGAMAAILGLDAAAVREAAAEASTANEVCELANDNGGGQIVVSGHRAAVERAQAAAKAKGAKRTVPLPVSGPFHSSLMAPAAREMADVLAGVTIRPPSVPVVANVTARPHEGPETIRRRLVEQITGTVRWQESVAWMSGAGVTRFVEVGSGKVLSGLVKRIAADAETASVGTPDDVAAVGPTL